jgi:hypothetical protein
MSVVRGIYAHSQAVSTVRSPARPARRSRLSPSFLTDLTICLRSLALRGVSHLPRPLERHPALPWGTGSGPRAMRADYAPDLGETALEVGVAVLRLCWILTCLEIVIWLRVSKTKVVLGPCSKPCSVSSFEHTKQITMAWELRVRRIEITRHLQTCSYRMSSKEENTFLQRLDPTNTSADQKKQSNCVTIFRHAVCKDYKPSYKHGVL